jgi:hypothetical protein
VTNLQKPLKTNGILFKVPEEINKEDLLILKSQRTGKALEYYKSAAGKLLNTKENISKLDKNDGLYIKSFSGSSAFLNNLIRAKQRLLREVL